jgi:hypothetical protein
MSDHPFNYPQGLWVGGLCALIGLFLGLLVGAAGIGVWYYNVGLLSAFDEGRILVDVALVSAVSGFLIGLVGGGRYW